MARTHFGTDGVRGIVGDALKGCDDGEMFLEYAQSESVLFDDGRVKNANFDTGQGFGLRGLAIDQDIRASVPQDEIEQSFTLRGQQAGPGGQGAFAVLSHQTLQKSTHIFALLGG